MLEWVMIVVYCVLVDDKIKYEVIFGDIDCNKVEGIE